MYNFFLVIYEGRVAGLNDEKEVQKFKKLLLDGNPSEIHNLVFERDFYDVNVVEICKEIPFKKLFSDYLIFIKVMVELLGKLRGPPRGDLWERYMDTVAIIGAFNIYLNKFFVETDLNDSHILECQRIYQFICDFYEFPSEDVMTDEMGDYFMDRGLYTKCITDFLTLVEGIQDIDLLLDAVRWFDQVIATDETYPDESSGEYQGKFDYDDWKDIDYKQYWRQKLFQYKFKIGRLLMKRDNDEYVLECIQTVKNHQSFEWEITRIPELMLKYNRISEAFDLYELIFKEGTTEEEEVENAEFIIEKLIDIIKELQKKEDLVYIELAQMIRTNAQELFWSDETKEYFLKGDLLKEIYNDSLEFMYNYEITEKGKQKTCRLILRGKLVFVSNQKGIEEPEKEILEFDSPNTAQLELGKMRFELEAGGFLLRNHSSGSPMDRKELVEFRTARIPDFEADEILLLERKIVLYDGRGFKLKYVDNIFKYIEKLDEFSIFYFSTKNNRVSGIVIRSPYFSFLPESFGNFEHLENLDFRFSQLSSLPESFGNLTLLEQLYLDSNVISTLPESFGNLKSLRILSLHSNKLLQLPDSFGKLVALKYLDLSSNMFVKFPLNITKLELLEHLKLEKNKIEAIPESIGNLRNLSILEIHKNQIAEIPETIGDLSLLSILNMEFNNLTTLPESLSKLPSLKYLLFYGNNIKTDIPLLPTMQFSEGGWADFWSHNREWKPTEIVNEGRISHDGTNLIIEGLVVKRGWESVVISLIEIVWEKHFQHIAEPIELGGGINKADAFHLWECIDQETGKTGLAVYWRDIDDYSFVFFFAKNEEGEWELIHDVFLN